MAAAAAVVVVAVRPRTFGIDVFYRSGCMDKLLRLRDVSHYTPDCCYLDKPRPHSVVHTCVSMVSNSPSGRQRSQEQEANPC